MYVLNQLYRVFVCLFVYEYRHVKDDYTECPVHGKAVGGGQTLHECILCIHLLIRVTIKIYDMRRIYFNDDDDDCCCCWNPNVCIQNRIHHKTDGMNVFRNHITHCNICFNQPDFAIILPSIIPFLFACKPNLMQNFLDFSTFVVDTTDF